MSNTAEPSRLSRKLNTTDAVIIGLGSMIGAGMALTFAFYAAPEFARPLAVRRSILRFERDHRKFAQ